MHAAVRSALALVLFGGLAGLGYYSAQAWQARQATYERLDVVADCDLRAGPCVVPLRGGELALSISPHSIPLMRTLQLGVNTIGLDASGVAVEIRGLNMDMGLNRTVLVSDGDGGWRGETILPVCSQRRMAWEAAVQVDAGERVEVPFPFATVRP